MIEDVRRFGGFGIAAHPGSPRESLRWMAWEAPFDGLEWLNADSEWRDEPRLPIMRTLLTYALRPAESITMPSSRRFWRQLRKSEYRPAESEAE